MLGHRLLAQLGNARPPCYNWVPILGTKQMEQKDSAITDIRVREVCFDDDPYPD